MTSGDLEVLLSGRAIIVSIKKISKMGMVCIVYEETSEGSGPKLPWILHMCHLLKSQMWIPLYDIDGDSLIFYIFYITQRRRKSDLFFPKSANKYLLLGPSSNKHKIIVYLLPK